MQNLLKNLPLYIIFALVGVNIFVWHTMFAEQEQLLTVAFLDIGQGDAIFIEAPNGNQMLVDGGMGTQVLQELANVMEFHDRAIDVVVATHPDLDHIGGLVTVMRNFEVSLYIESGVSHDSQAAQELQNIVREKSLESIIAKRGMRIHLDSEHGVFADVLFPDRDTVTMKPNDASIIMRLVYGESEVMLTGDAPSGIERYLVAQDGMSLDSDILKLGHHGSNTSSARSFLEAVSPDAAIVSAGCGNRYGHPHGDVVDRVAVQGINVFDTCTEGTTVFTSNGKVFTKQ